MAFINVSNSILSNFQDKYFCIYSYNSRGFAADKQEVCKKLLQDDKMVIPILCNQEHFLLKANGYMIQQALHGYHIVFKLAENEFLDGRPKNGMFIAIPSELKSKVKEISLAHPRLQAMTLDTGCKTLLVINVYFPQDPKMVNYKVNEDLEDILTSINIIIEHCTCDDVIIAEDFNMVVPKDSKFFAMTTSLNHLGIELILITLTCSN